MSAIRPIDGGAKYRPLGHDGRPLADRDDLRDLYEDQVPPHAPGVAGNGDPEREAAADATEPVVEPKPKRARKPRSSSSSTEDATPDA